jgi:Subtilase family
LADGDSVERPVLWGRLGPAISFSTNGRGSSKVKTPSRQRQGERLQSKFNDLETAFEDQVAFVQSLGASDPELVVVFEALDEQLDLTGVAERIGIEILSEVDSESGPDPDFPRTSTDQSLPVPGCLHAVCVSSAAMSSLLRQWSEWQRTGELERGYAPLRDLFAHLKDVRPWGPQDRVRATDWNAYLAELLPGNHEVEIELWYRLSDALRAKAEAEVTALINQAGGTVLSSAQVGEVGYHGMKCLVPLGLLQDLAAGNLDAVSVVKSNHIMFVRGSAQSHAFSEPSATVSHEGSNLPSGDPVLCVLDGVPVSNHPALSDRVIVYDPDDLASVSSTDLRRHGTAMASVCVWGDLSTPNAAPRPVLVRPILAPAAGTIDNAEELRQHELAPDLMRRVFRELFDGDGTTGPAADSVVIVNLSVGDPGVPFDGILSSWARTLDWLSANYGVIVVVSAGNHATLAVEGGAETISALSGRERAEAVNRAVARAFPRRSILAPGDAINAVTVGALNDDGAGEVVTGPYRIDPSGEVLIVNPVSALGGGYRRSVKPDLLGPGGRTYFRLPMQGETHLVSAQGAAFGPGVRVAAADGYSDVFTSGTSPASASVAKAAAGLVDTISQLADGPITRRSLAVGTKALLAHSARVPADLVVNGDLRFHAHGYGGVARDFREGCAENEATILFIGQISANQERTLDFPLPGGLQANGIKRITATLAWLSPVNWRHRQYRCGALTFAKPVGMTELGTPIDVPADAAKRGTLQHLVWEVTRPVQFGEGDDVRLKVQCREQAGGLHGEPIDFAVAVSLWVAPELNVDVYTQVRDRVAARVPVTA